MQKKTTSAFRVSKTRVFDPFSGGVFWGRFSDKMFVVCHTKNIFSPQKIFYFFFCAKKKKSAANIFFRLTLQKFFAENFSKIFSYSAQKKFPSLQCFFAPLEKIRDLFEKKKFSLPLRNLAIFFSSHRPRGSTPTKRRFVFFDFCEIWKFHKMQFAIFEKSQRHDFFFKKSFSRFL